MLSLKDIKYFNYNVIELAFSNIKDYRELFITDGKNGWSSGGFTVILGYLETTKEPYCNIKFDHDI